MLRDPDLHVRRSPWSARWLCAALLLCWGGAGRSFAEDLLVPDSYPTIQAAINAAQPGDRVLVAPGSYSETLDFLGKAITVEGAGGPALTTLIGGVQFVNGEGSDSVLAGLGVVPVPGEPGQGIHCLGSGPAIHDCWFTGHFGQHGSGVRIEASSMSPVISGCRFEANHGLALYANGTGSITVENCQFVDNFSVVQSSAAILAMDTIHVTGCVFEGNEGSQGSALGIGPLLEGGLGADNALIENCMFVGNSSALCGALIAFNSTVVVRDCSFVSNGTGNGAGCMDMGSIRFERCLFVENTGLNAVFATSLNGGQLELVQCTFAANVTPRVVLVNDGVTGTIDSCIFWSNSASSYAITPAGTATFQYTILPEPVAGTGNLSLDPLFRDPDAGDYGLLPSSPAIDTANPMLAADPDGSAPDRGALPYDHGSPPFIRGDANQDRRVDIGDGIHVIGVLFQGAGPLGCAASGDTNGDGRIDVADAISIFSYVLLDGPPPPAPFPSCGEDPASALACELPGPSGC